MFRSVNDLQSAILSYEPKDFVSHFLFEPIPALFYNDLKLWIGWKSTLASLLDIDPYDIVLTGSAAVGYSLNPHKNFKQFDNSSDIDCGIISNYHFDVAWRHLRNLRVSWTQLPRKTRDAISSHRNNYIFEATIATDRILGLLPYGTIWLDALSKMADLEPTRGRQVRLRIYKDYGALRHYQAKGVGQLRERSLASESLEDQNIDIDDLG